MLTSVWECCANLLQQVGSLNVPFHLECLGLRRLSCGRYKYPALRSESFAKALREETRTLSFRVVRQRLQLDIILLRSIQVALQLIDGFLVQPLLLPRLAHLHFEIVDCISLFLSRHHPPSMTSISTEDSWTP